MIHKRLSLLTAALVLNIALNAQVKTPYAIMEEAKEAFLQSGQLLTKDTRWSHAHEEWQFILTAKGDTIVEPEALRRLADTFAQSAGLSSFAYRNEKGNGPELPLEMQFHRKDNFYGGIYGTYTLDNSQNVQVIALNDDNHRTTFYGLKWNTIAFNDRNGNPWRTLQGVLFAFKDGIWRIEVKQHDRTWDSMRKLPLPSLSNNNQLKYETLMAQIQRLNNLSNSNHDMQTDLYLYMLAKLCDDFTGQLSEQQYKNITNLIQPFSQQTLSDNQQRIFKKSITRLQQHTRPLPNGIVNTNALTNNTPLADPEQRRLVNLCYDFGQEKLATANVSLTIKAVGTVSVASNFPQVHQFDLVAHNGQVVINETFLKEQLLTITDQQGNQIALFADTIPTQVSLAEMSIKGSPQNEQFAQAQRQLKALEPEMHKYSYCSADGDHTIIDDIGHKQLLGDAHKLLLQLLDENTNNLIPVWLLATNFNTMSHDELNRYLKHDRPYANHVALQPVWQYCEGLVKRQPGRLFADAQCVDTAGVSHRLSEYIGKGEYVVLQFWQERDWTAHSQCKYMKQIAKEHAGDRIRIIGLSLDSDKQRWKRYVKKRDLCYQHLATPHTDNANPWISDAAKAYGISTLPETIIFDPEGRIISTGLTGENLTRYVDALSLKQ